MANIVFFSSWNRGNLLLNLFSGFPQMVGGHFNPGLFNPKLQLQTFNPRLFNHELSNQTLGWKVWGWSLGLKSPGLKCPSTDLYNPLIHGCQEIKSINIYLVCRTLVQQCLCNKWESTTFAQLHLLNSLVIIYSWHLPSEFFFFLKL